MAFTKLIMQNQYTGEVKQAPIGFSWTSLFFGGFVPIVRGNYGAGFLWIFLSICTGGFAVIVQAFIYNKKYLNFLINNGYQVKHSQMPIEHVASKLNMTLPVLSEA